MDNKERLEKVMQFDLVQAIKDGFEDSSSVKQQNILSDVEWLINTVKHQQDELNQLNDLYGKVFNHREKLLDENFELREDRDMWMSASRVQGKQAQQLEQENALLKAAAKPEKITTYTHTGNLTLNNGIKTSC